MASNGPAESEVTMADVEAGKSNEVRKISTDEPRDNKETMQNTSDGEVTPQAAPEDDLDPSLPLNWSTTKKFYNMAVPSIICLVV
jgi:hypothetical protein